MLQAGARRAEGTGHARQQSADVRADILPRMGAWSVAARHPRAIVMMVLVFAGLAAPRDTSAQIYAWRDSKGTLVLSDRPINAPTAVYEVAGAPAYRTTTPLERPADDESIESLVVEHSQRHSLRPELVRAVIQVESGFNPRATSPKGAMGLMQLMPAHRAGAGRGQRLRSGREHPRRHGLPAADCSTGTTATSAWRSRPTTPAPARSIGTAARCRPIARPATTSAASASRLGPAPHRL